jgi:glutamine synthetase
MCTRASSTSSPGENIFSNEDGTSVGRVFALHRRFAALHSGRDGIGGAVCEQLPPPGAHTAAPINIEWGYDNRTVGIRSPISSPQARRVENRVIGADANPYVALAMTLACGYLGLKNKIKPKPEMKGDAYLAPYSLPRSLGEALDWLRREIRLARGAGQGVHHRVHRDQGTRV